MRNVRSILFFFLACYRPANDLRETLRLAAPRLAVILVDFVAIVHKWAGISDELPADQAGIAAMHRVTEHSLNGRTGISMLVGWAFAPMHP